LPVHVVLVRPEAPANIGAVARAVRNTGLAGLRLVSPGDWRTVDCWRTAWGSHEVLEQARVFDDLRSALADAQTAWAFSGRREKEASWRDVREAAAELAGRGEETACLVFGPESSGLTQEELSRCGERVFIPAHPDQPSLNLSHAVMVAAYEVFRAAQPPVPFPRRATLEEKAAMLARLRDGLVAIGALPETNTEIHLRDWEALFARADLTPREVRLLEHLGRKMAKPRGSHEPEG
jgi:tRNA/rRNA methyltransferase